MKYFTGLILSLSTLLFPAASVAQSNEWTVKDVINDESAYGWEFSPDGNAVVWVKRRADHKKDRHVTDLHLTRLDIRKDGTFKTVQLTRGSESDHSPIFSKDGEIIYFLSSRDEGKKLWAMSIYGGEPYEVHTFDTGISDLQWMGDHKLAFKSDEGKTLYERELEEAKDNTVVVEDTAHYKASRVYSFNLESKEIRRLTTNEYPVGEYEVSSDGRWLVTSHILSPSFSADAHPKPTYYLWDLNNGSKRQILEHGYQTPGNFEFTDDNNGFYFASVKSSDPQWNGAGITLLHYFNLDSNTATQVPINWDWGLGGSFDLVGNDLLVSLANGPTMKLAYLEKTESGWNKKAVEAGSMNGHITITGVGKQHNKIAYVYSTASTPPQYRIAELERKRRAVEIPKGDELVELNTHFDKKKIARSEVIRWEGALGDEISGILYYPHDYKEGRQYPLVVTIHGGPASVDLDRWNESWTDFNNIMAQKGAFVFMPNYHGSGNHGLEFVESIKGHYYEFEIPDIVSGVEMLVDRGLVDPDSLGVKGWSNGAILTTKLTLEHPDMFKVAAPGAGDVNWTSDYGTCRFGVQFDQSYFIGAPWDDTNGKIYNENYILKSPLFELEKVTTPTLIHHGSEDRAVPRDQGWEYYRALQQSGKAPVRFLWYPGQPHGLQKITHQTRKIEEEIRWFDKHLFGTFEPENEAFKEESPLAALLQIDDAQQQDGLYGINQQDMLIPETVQIKEDSISIGRFEVTNAQFAEFDPNHTYQPVQANYPAAGITLEQAQVYVTWLSDQTGHTYRLPNEKEAESLHKQARRVARNENTLNYWAGYDITLDDVKEFRQKLDGVKTSILKEAGAYKGVSVGEATVFDLGGNVAELYSTDEPSKIYGYSAASFVDDRRETPEAPTEYTGFRVIKE